MFIDNELRSYSLAVFGLIKNCDQSKSLENCWQAISESQNVQPETLRAALILLSDTPLILGRNSNLTKDKTIEMVNYLESRISEITKIKLRK